MLPNPCPPGAPVHPHFCHGCPLTRPGRRTRGVLDTWSNPTGPGSACAEVPLLAQWARRVPWVMPGPPRDDPVAPSTSARMKRTGQRDTKPELAVRRLLHAQGLRYRVNVAPDGGRSRADIVFKGPMIAVYIDGCFWHGCPEHATWPKNNAKFWREKIEANRARDLRVTEKLTAAEWLVLRFWEHEDPMDVAQTIRTAVLKAKGSRRR